MLRCFCRCVDSCRIAFRLWLLVGNGVVVLKLLIVFLFMCN